MVFGRKEEKYHYVDVVVVFLHSAINSGIDGGGGLCFVLKESGRIWNERTNE